MSVTLERAGGDAARDAAELLRREWPTGWEPRPSGEVWWQTRQSRDELVARLSGLFISPNNGRPRDKIRRRGLNRLLDWLEQQPGETWQERWLASGADEAGRDWTDLPLRGTHAPRHHREDLCTGALQLVCGQVIRPAYRWLFAQRQVLMLAEARQAIDPDGFTRLQALRPAGRTGPMR